MSDYHCLDIEFPNIDFSSYYIESKIEISNVFHAHLYSKIDEIELRLFYDDRTFFGEKLLHWTGKISWDKFGSFLKVEVSENSKKRDLKKVDLSFAKLIGAINSSEFYENGKKYVILKINTVKYYWAPVEHEINTGEFYLDSKGFNVLRPFYSFLTATNWQLNDGVFDIGRMDNAETFYELGKSIFRPEFNFVTNDDREKRVATIVKEPKIQFKYTKPVTEKEALLYGELVLLLASFYHHIKIDYIFQRIHLPENTITIKNIESKNFIEKNECLRGFGISWDFNEFLQTSWQEESLKNYNILSKAITQFNQSHIVDDYSSFLIRFNIIEICDKQKQENMKFKLVLNKSQVKEKYNEALKILLETIETNEHEDFKKRWNNIQTNLQNKTMKSQLNTFLESQNIDPKIFPIKIEEIIALRNNITHGSIDKVNSEQVVKANILLYRICGIIILNLMGVKKWKLNTELR